MNNLKQPLVVLILFLAILFVLEFGSQALEPLVTKGNAYPPILFEAGRYLLLSLAVCFFVWYSLISCQDKIYVSIIYLFVGSILFLLLSKNVYFFIHTIINFPPDLNQVYVAWVTPDLNMLRIGASIIISSGFIKLLKPRKFNKLS